MYASGFWRIHAKTSRGIVTTIRMKNGVVIELEAAWALNTLEVDEAKTSLCGTKAGADMKDGLRINYIHHNKQVVEKPALSGEGVAFFSGEEKPAGDYEQELFYHIVADGAEQVVKPAHSNPYPA